MMVAILYGRNYGQFVIATIVVAFMMSSFPPQVDCAMSAEQSMFKMLSVKNLLNLFEVTQADDHIRASTKKTFHAAFHKCNVLYQLSSAIYQMEPQERIPTSFERLVQEMDEAVDLLPPLESLDPFLGHVLEKLHNSFKPLKRWYFKSAALRQEMTRNPESQTAISALADHEKRYKAVMSTQIAIESALKDYRNVWEHTQVRPSEQADMTGPVLDAVDAMNRAFREDFAELFNETSGSRFWFMDPFWSLLVGVAIGALVTILIVGVALYICLGNRKHHRTGRIVSSRSKASGWTKAKSSSSNTKTDTSLAQGHK